MEDASLKCVVNYAQSFTDKENYCERQFINGGPFWHYFTDGTKQGIIFTNANDFKVGINQLAISASRSNVRIIAFALMSNHIHVIAQSPMINGMNMVQQFASKIKYYLKSQNRTYSNSLLNVEAPIEITNLKMMRNEIVYVIRNGYVADANYTPVSYPWGSGRLYFINDILDGRNLLSFNELPFAVKRMILMARVSDLPDNYIVSGGMIDSGMIHPASFCDYKFGESFFRDAHHYFNMLSKDFEAYSEIAKRLNDSIFYTDEEMYSAISQYCRKIYGVSIPQIVDASQKIELAKKMHNDFNCSNKQIQRILKLNNSILDTIFPKTVQ